MKNYIYILIATAISILSSCTEFKEDIGFVNGVYMENPSNSELVSMKVSTLGEGSVELATRLANIANKDISVTIAFNAETLTKYNTSNNSKLLAVDSNDFYFVDNNGEEKKHSITFVIKKGEYNSTFKVKIKNLDTKKYVASKSFAIPLIIKKVSQGRIMNSQHFSLIKLDRIIKTSIGKFSNGGIKVFPKKPFEKPMKEWTFQMSAIYSSLSRPNLTTAYMSDGSGELYTRISATKGIQIKNGRDGDDTWTSKALEPNKWLNISYVYKENTIKVYVNGILQKQFKTTPIYLKNTEGSGWSIGNGGYRNDYIREIRFWDKALSKSEIVEKLYLPQDKNTPNLLMYIPVTKETGITELTGKWNVTKPNEVKIEYIDNVIFPSEKLVIKK